MFAEQIFSALWYFVMLSMFVNLEIKYNPKSKSKASDQPDLPFSSLSESVYQTGFDIEDSWNDWFFFLFFFSGKQFFKLEDFFEICC